MPEFILTAKPHGKESKLLVLDTEPHGEIVETVLADPVLNDKGQVIKSAWQVARQELLTSFAHYEGYGYLLMAMPDSIKDSYEQTDATSDCCDLGKV